MTLYLETPSGFVPWAGEAISGVRHPRSIEQHWSSDELAAIGLFAPEPADPVPEGKISTGQVVQRVNGVVKFVHVLMNKPQPTLAERREELLPRLAQKRWEVETGGITVAGVTIRTDEVGQAKLTGALALMDKDPEMTSVDWEGQPGIWATLDKPTLETIGVAVGRHIQACFSRARAISEAIQSASTHAAMDAAEAQIDQGWPG